MTQFRPATESDSQQIVEMIRAAFARTARELSLTPEGCPPHPAFYTLDRLRSDQARGRCFYVVEEGGRLAGCVYLRKATDEVYEIGRLAVLPALQRGGLGARLMREAEEIARSAGGKRVNIDTLFELTPLVRWYQQLGYVIDGVEDIPSIPRPVARMHKQLTAEPCSAQGCQCTCA